MNTLELREAYNDSDILNTCEVAVYSVASDILQEANTVSYHAERWVWAKNAMDNPRAEGQKLLALVLMENKAAALATVKAAQYSAFVININNIIDGYVTDKVA